MPIIVCGVNHNSASVAIRETLVIPEEEVPEVLASLVGHSSINEALLLSTCNRWELYCSAYDETAAVDWLQSHYHFSQDMIDRHTYLYQDQDAIMHLMRVASGMDSMMLGEPQIFGQLKDAFELACQQGCVGLDFNHLFPYIFSVTKKIRTQTAIGQQPISIAYAAVSLAKCVFSHLSCLKVLVIGAGDTVELALQHFKEQGVSQFVMANRTLSRAVELAGKYGGQSLSLDQIPTHLGSIDVVLSATGCPENIVSAHWVEQALKVPHRRPMFLVDLAVPRDIDPRVAELNGAYLYNIDDLRSVSENGLAKRKEAALGAEKIIAKEADSYFSKLQEREYSGTVRAYRSKVEQLRDRELTKAIQLLSAGKDPQEVVMLLARSLTNKLMHHPTVQMRKAGDHGKQDFLDAARRLLDINE